MSKVSMYRASAANLAAEAEAIGRLAQDSGAFAAAVAAFESNDPQAFAWVLERIEPLPECRLICEWIRVKLCTLRCVQLCGQAEPDEDLPELPAFTEAIIHLASHRALLRRVVDAVSCGDADAYQAAVAEAKLQKFCGLLCRYVCSTIFRQICEVVCSSRPLVAVDAALQIQADAEVLSRVSSNKRLVAAIQKAAVSLEYEPLRLAIGQAGVLADCELICLWICVWRCAWVCRALCREPAPVLAGPQAVAEARAFALATLPLVGQPRALGDLVEAVASRNADTFSAVVARFDLGAYCWQLCTWVCSDICHQFCILFCPIANKPPLFTYVGHFDISTDIDAATGRTNKGLSFPGLYYNGGPNFAFTGQLQLAGFCPIYSPLDSSTLMQYRFLYAVGGGTPAPVTGGLLSPVQVGTQAVTWPSNVGGLAQLPMRTLHPAVMVSSAAPSSPVAPTIGSVYVDPTPFNLQPDPVDGWVTVDPSMDQSGLDVLMGFDTTQAAVAPGGDPSPGVAAGTAVPAAQQRAGSSVAITFEATRVGTLSPPDYQQAPVTIRVNNYAQVHELNLLEFVTSGDCCTPIVSTLSVQYTVDHEEMDAGAWSLTIDSCSTVPASNLPITPSTPNTTLATAINDLQTTLTVASTAGFAPPPFPALVQGTGEILQVTGLTPTTMTVTRGSGGSVAEAAPIGAVVQAMSPPGVTARGGAGTVVENTLTPVVWENCSYQVWMSTRPGLTNGLVDVTAVSDLVTFCICGH